MMEGLRIKVAAVLMLGILSVLGSAQGRAANRNPVRYTCGERQDLTIQRNEATARVRFEDRSYELQRKASGIGEKYISPTAALIIDGSSAVFVANDQLQLGACMEAVPTASLR